jgi:hypothetical protein
MVHPQTIIRLLPMDILWEAHLQIHQAVETILRIVVVVLVIAEGEMVEATEGEINIYH